MNTTVNTVGAFEAKTKFSELLSRVAETGASLLSPSMISRLPASCLHQVSFAGESRKSRRGMASPPQTVPAGRPEDQRLDQRRPAMTSEFVLDGSLTMAWCFEDEASHQSDEIQDWLAAGARVNVPTLWHLEIANVLWAASGESGLRKQIARSFWRFLPP